MWEILTRIIEIVDMDIFDLLDRRESVILTAPSPERVEGVCAVHSYAIQIDGFETSDIAKGFGD